MKMTSLLWRHWYWEQSAILPTTFPSQLAKC